jgi:hypothetical protein
VPLPSTPPIGPWVEGWLSSPRFGVYLHAVSGDRHRALELYEWNSQLSAAVLHDLGHFEIALRNAYAAALDAAWRGSRHWLDDPVSPLRAPLIRTKRGGPRGKRQVDLNDNIRNGIDAARRRYGAQAPPGKIIADLSLGLWRYLSSNAHEKTLWVPYLHRAFPAGTSRVAVDRKIGDLHQLRNRAAHWEPLLNTPVKPLMADLATLCRLLHPELADYIQAHSQVSVLLASRP